MSKLNVDQKSIYELLSDRKADYIIPDYQRPYAWDEDNCQTLWDDIFSFAIPDNDATKFDTNDEYFLGSIVTFENDKKQQEVIDGQQRLTTLCFFSEPSTIVLRKCKTKILKTSLNALLAASGRLTKWASQIKNILK